MVWKRRKLAALMVCDVCAPWALNVRVCLRQEEASIACIWAISFRVSLRRGVTLVVMWRVSLRHITDDHLRAGLQQWELQSLLSTTFFLSGLTPTPLGPPFLTFLYCLSSWMRLQTSALTGSDCQFKWLYCWSSCWRRRMPTYMSLGLETRMFKMSPRQDRGFGWC